MSLPATIDNRRPVTTRALLLALAALVALVVAARLANVGQVAAAQNFVLIFTAIVVEAMPFILIGAIAGALLGSNAKKVVFVARLKDGRKFMGRTSPRVYTQLQAALL